MNPSIIINIVTAVITLTVGAWVLLGDFFPSGNVTTKYLFGIVMIAYGIYRLANTYSKIRRQKMDERLEELSEEREKLLSKR